LIKVSVFPAGAIFPIMIWNESSRLFSKSENRAGVFLGGRPAIRNESVILEQEQ
jgi:hypothetical protein